MSRRMPEIRDLSLVGDRRTVAVVANGASIVWYCPGRFDAPSLFASLLDAGRGGGWTIEADGLHPAGRGYREDSAVLETRLKTASGGLTVTDWMPLGDGCPNGICRLFSTTPVPLRVCIRPAPGYARRGARIEAAPPGLCIDGRHWLYASTQPVVDDTGAAVFGIGAGSDGWAMLVDAPLEAPCAADLHGWLGCTLAGWREVASRITYRGPFEREVAQSLRALRLLTCARSGGVIAAATTSLPEVPGGTRNYDYRYVWLRDAGMIASALVRAGSTGPDEERFLGFICSARQHEPDRPVLPPFLSLDHEPAPDESHLDLAGYADSRPVRIGNGANRQLQLDAFANVLLAAKLIYRKQPDGTRPHWQTVREVADVLAERWREPDHGIWEESARHPYTTGKVIASCGLRYIADFADDAAQAARWRSAAARIDAYVAERCMTREGAYAVYAGSDAVDVSAALYPAWGYVDADAAAMCATMRALERDCCRNDLYWRHLVEPPARPEGAFLAGTVWVAQYWVLRGDLARARRILAAVFAYSNDLGLFAEEADPDSDAMLGNFPQTFVHASLIGAVIDYAAAERGST